MGFEQAGFTCLFQVEWDKHCQSVLNRHWPDVPKWGDVCDVDGSWLPPVDVLIFGSPCQDLSVAGKRSGLDGGRSSMFYEATRIIKEMQRATDYTYPRIVVWENVPGALTSNKGADFQAVLDEMADCGSYLTEWAVLDAQHFGVPQRRRRIFLIAVLDPRIATECPDPLFPVAQGRRGDYEKGIPKGKTAADSTSRSPRTHSFDTQFGSNANIFNDMSPTLKSSQNAPSVQHEYTVRRITPLECERLMGWPDDHTRWTAEGKEQSDSARYKQCGNGVATPVAKWIAQQLEPLL